MRGFGHVVIVLAGAVLTAVILWGETAGVVHAFRAHGADAGWQAVLVPPIAWWRGLELLTHPADEVASTEAGEEPAETLPEPTPPGEPEAKPEREPVAEPTPRPTGVSPTTAAPARPTAGPREVTRPAPPLLRRTPPGEKAIRPTELVVNSAARLYESPSIDAPVIVRLREGTVVTAVAESGEWLRIRSRSNRPDGWIERAFVRDADR
jgi:hypothetical protein